MRTKKIWGWWDINEEFDRFDDWTAEGITGREYVTVAKIFTGLCDKMLMGVR